MSGTGLSKEEWETHYHQELIEDLGENIAKIYALTKMALSSNMKEIKDTTLFHYWDSLNDLARAAKQLCEELDSQN